jgi:uncharacterized RDD family membrane protein YckC
MTSTAGLLPRVVAKVIDLVLASIAYEILHKTGLYAGIIYLLISDSLFDGKSIGKLVLKLRVVRENGKECTVKESMIRNIPIAAGFLLWKIPLIGWILFLAILILEFVILFGNDKGMRFGDEMARTYVIETEPVSSTE